MAGRLATLLLCLAALLAFARAGAAQVAPAVDVGVIAIANEGVPLATAVTVTPSLRYERPLLLLSTSGTFAGFDTHEWSAHGALAASGFTPEFRGIRGELSGATSGIAYRRIVRSGEARAIGRLHFQRDGFGAWVGAGGGRAWYSGTSHPLSFLDGGGWTRIDDFSISAGIAHVAVAASDSFHTHEQGVIRLPMHGTHTDVTASVSWIHPLVRFDLVGGARRGNVIAEDALWGAVSGAVHLTPWLSLVADVGIEPANATQRLPEGRYALVALSLASRRLPRSQPRNTPLGTFIVPGTQGELRTVRFTVPGASRVELRGDFTDWRPVPMLRDSGEDWVLILRLLPGTYRVMVRVDDGDWEAPPGVPGFKDEFGGMVGLLVVQ